MKVSIQHRKLTVGVLAALLSFGVFAEDDIQWTEYAGSGPFPDAPNVWLRWKSGGYTVNLTDADVPMLERLENLQMSADSSTKIVIKNETTPFVFKAKVIGTAGNIVFQDSAGVTITADNSGLTHWSAYPHFEFKNSKVTVLNEKGLGGVDRVECAAQFVFGANSEIHFDKPGSNVFTNYCAIHTKCEANCRTMIFGSETLGKHFVQNAEFIQESPGPDYPLIFSNNFEQARGRFVVRNASDNCWAELAASETCLKVSDAANLCLLGYLRLNGKGTCIINPDADPTIDVANGGVQPGPDVHLVIGRDNVLGADDGVSSHFQTQLALAPTGEVDLNGHDLSVGRLAPDYYSSWSETSLKYARLTSSTPATLRIVGTSATTANAVIPVRFEGAASLSFETATHKAELVRTASTSTGDLTVSAGTLGLRLDASWNGENVIVKGTGVLEVNSSCAFTNNAQKLVVSESGKIRILNGGVAKFASAKLGAVDLEPGAHTIAELKANAATADYIDDGSFDAATIDIDMSWKGWPEEPGKTAVVPAGEQVTVGDGDVEKVNQLGGLKIMAGAVVTFANATRAARLAVPVEGFGAIKAVDSCGLTIGSDNRAWGGHFEFDNSKVWVTDEHGLGGAGGAAVLTFRTNSELHFDKPGSNVFTNYCAISCDCDNGCKTMIFGSESPDKLFVQKGDLLQRHQNINRYMYFRNNFEIIEGGFPWNNAYGDNFYCGLSGNGEACVRIGADTALCLKRSFQVFDGKGSVHFDMSKAVTGDYANGGLLKEAFIDVCLHRENVLGASAFKLPFYQFYLASADVGRLDLCGCVQEIGVIGIAWNGGTVSESSTGYTIVNSDEEGGLLKVTGESGDYVPFNNDLPVLFTGSAAFEMAANGNSIYLVRKVSTSSGDLTVSAGTLGFKWDGGWSGSNVFVKGTGILGVQSAKAFTNKCQRLVVDESGKIVLRTAGVAKFASVKLGEKELEPGSYTVAALKADPAVAQYVDGDDAATLDVNVAEEEWTGWPDTPGATAIVPAGQTVQATDADAAKIATLGALTLRAGSTVVFVNAETPIELSAPVTGSGVIKIVDSVGVRIAGDNSGLVSPGAFWITNSNVTVAHEKGLGGVDTGRASVYYTSKGFLKFDCGDNVVTNDVAIDFGCEKGDESYAVFGPESPVGRLVQNADFLCQTPGVNNGLWIAFTNDVEFAGGRFGMVGRDGFYTMIASGSRVTISQECVIEHVNGTGVWTVYFYGATDGTSQMAFDPKTIVKLPFVAFSRTNVRFAREMAVPSTEIFNIQRFAPGMEDYAFDLNGHSQTIGNFQTGWWNRGYDILEGQTERAVVTSSIPATVTVTDSALASNAVSYVGQVSLNYVGLGTNVNLIAKSRTLGDLTVTSGTQVFDWGANWVGKKALVKSGASLRLGADSADNFFGTASEVRVNRMLLDLETGGTLEIVSGTVCVYEAFMNGERVPRGTWGKNDFPWIKGEGRLRVMHDDGGLVIMVH